MQILSKSANEGRVCQFQGQKYFKAKRNKSEERAGDICGIKCVNLETMRIALHRSSQGGQKRPCPPKFLENIVIFCFERRCSRQNSVIRLKSNILAPSKFFRPPPNFWAGYATVALSHYVIELWRFLIPSKLVGWVRFPVGSLRRLEKRYLRSAQPCTRHNVWMQ